jgi:hypothetical protein
MTIESGYVDSDLRWEWTPRHFQRRMVAQALYRMIPAEQKEILAACFGPHGHRRRFASVAAELRIDPLVVSELWARWRYALVSREYKAPRLGQGVCEVCERVFSLTGTVGKRYCQEQCRVRAQNERARARATA